MYECVRSQKKPLQSDGSIGTEVQMEGVQSISGRVTDNPFFGYLRLKCHVIYPICPLTLSDFDSQHVCEHIKCATA